MYIIFINESVLYLVDKPINNTAIKALNFNEIDIEDTISRLEKGELESIFILHEDLDELWIKFKKHFTIIEAAGGLVFNEKNETLWIYRHDKWDLPKGKVESNENIEQAALREVEEECGVTNLKLMAPLQKTYHVYTYNNKRILKVTHWFKLFANSDQNLSPQLEEHITKVEWIANVKTKKVLENTYGNIKLLCKFAFL